MAERGVKVDQATLNRWVIKYSPGIAKAAQLRNRSWRMDETYIKVKGKRMYLYRAIDKHEKPLILCSQNGEIRLRLGYFSGLQLKRIASLQEV